MTKSLRVLVVGGGMYVAGRGMDGYYGTVMPALLEERRRRRIGAIAIATTRPETAAAAARETAAIAAVMNVDGACETWPRGGADGEAFLWAADEFQPDCAIVVVPDHLHATVTVPLAERGIHCLVVKPLAGTLADARAMAAAAGKAGIVAEVEFHKRLDESNLMLRDAVVGGRIGTPLYATVEYSQRKAIPRNIFRAWADRTSIFQYLAVHYVDLLGWATGFTPVRVSAWGQKEYLLRQGIDTWDAIQAVIEWRRPDGGCFVSTHSTNWIDPDRTTATSDQRISIVGTEGRLDADQKHRGIRMVSDSGGVADPNPYFTGAWRRDDGALEFRGYGIRSVQQFLDDVRSVKAVAVTVAELDCMRPTFASCLGTVAVIEAAHRSLAEGGRQVDVETVA